METRSDIVLICILTPWLIGLATCAIQTAWFKKGGPFDVLRAYAEARGGWIGSLLTCEVCSAFHVAFWLTVFFAVPILVWPWLFPWLYLPLSYLSAVTMAHQLGIVPREDKTNHA